MRTFLLLALTFLLLLAGCCSAPTAPLFPPGPTVTSTPSLYSTAAHILGHGQPAMAGAHRQDRIDALEHVQLSGNDVADRRALMVAEGAVEQRWMPVWQAMRTLWQAYEGRRAAKARGEAGDDAELQKALCGLETAVPAKWKLALLPKIDGCR